MIHFGLTREAMASLEASKSDNDLNWLIDSVNVEINKMAIWFRANKLAVNKGKTKFIIFRTRGKNY